MRKAREHEVALKEIQIRVQESEKRLADRRDSLETTYNESTAELERMLANYDESVLMKTAEVQSLKNSITEIQGKIGALRGEYDKVNVLRGTADSLLQQLEGERAKLRSEISKVVIEYELPSRLCGDDWTLTQAKTVLQSLEAKVHSETKKIYYVLSIHYTMNSIIWCTFRLKMFNVKAMMLLGNLRRRYRCAARRCRRHKLTCRRSLLK